ncbi:2-C-methyl-D-erythritol 2,4-cyclodiphosphate synthase [Dehalococcoides mccartyi]|jgi:2-C-methyl-D-erythritol 2,4-cyclodiphosphate synthase|nr:2-C-methyl-D-erythritol 2,4-cyclodiphosphate synthase [Dehalococcoides mccartyi]AQW61764.1 2-C-methyl-D-erythritol 2,4-cyclodiphosphate synthase [Dehalococcoides mccartyi]AQX74028.1 2-C-methyl-D-erythritol 2,4-cyclodiphosphate synthase [Dehalococcoides mccartyi]AQY72541.1 2-C-methyl-D-erythritol 2,4-cyclodiphosphate synthase [Dehalococcoides mccartyi]OBW62516.1 MAG: 2-C-methyl-D-erythritol 2,4-cyclodiphosphate synthase [Dehalococcoides mccartyi]
MRIGNGYDVHRLAPGQKLVLGGVEIPFECGLIGWSDADVLTHAIMDSLLGAAALGDIGLYFPPGDPKYKGISSLKLLEQVTDLLAKKGFGIINVDSVIVAEEPKLRGHIDTMRKYLAKAMGIDPGRVGIKASTSEQLGFVGRQEGMVAWAVALVDEK